MTMSIPCPQCGTVLKLRDASLLGKTGKCPKCSHRFVLRDPDEVEMELVESPAPAAGRASAAPKVGTGAVWIPDSGPAAPAPLVIGASEADSLNRLKRKRRKRSLPQTIAMLAAVVIVGVGAVWGWQTFGSALTQPRVAAGKKAKLHKGAVPPAPDNGTSAEEGDGQVARTEGNEFGRPTSGKPIDLLWIPSGARIVISIRPAELWKVGALGEGEFMAGFGPLGKWMETWMKDYLMVEDVKEIEHALICLIPGSRGTPPEVAAVVERTAEHKFKKSDMIDRFSGQAVETGPMKYYQNETRAMVLRPDMRTYAICPAALAAEMVDASEIAKPTDGGIEELLLKTDRDLQFTVVCIPADLRIHGEFLAPANAQNLLQNVADWVSSDDEAEAVALAFHLTEQKFYLQLLARNSAVTKAHQLAKSFKSRLETTPRRILETIEMMNPQQLGPRKVIGRVPAMSKVVQLGTHVETGNRLVSLAYEGPERAGPNLALGTLLAWDESTRTKFGSSSATVGTATAERKPLKELLRTKIDVDFRRAPLEDAFNYIAGEAKFDIYVDGDALKAAGYTKNMPQTFKDDGIVASSALAKIITSGKYDKMCFVIDEAKSLVTVTTLQAAEDKKLKVYDMK